MEATKFAEQSISLQKNLFDSAFNTLCTIQDQTEQMSKTYLKQMTWIPEEGKKTIEQAADMFKKARDNFKKAVDEGFEKIEEVFSGK